MEIRNLIAIRHKDNEYKIFAEGEFVSLFKEIKDIKDLPSYEYTPGEKSIVSFFENMTATDSFNEVKEMKAEGLVILYLSRNTSVYKNGELRKNEMYAYRFKQIELKEKENESTIVKFNSLSQDLVKVIMTKKNTCEICEELDSKGYRINQRNIKVFH